MSAIRERALLPYARRTLTVSSIPAPSANTPVYSRNTGSEAAKDPALVGSHELLDQIARLPKDWDGHGSAKPNSLAVERARHLLHSAFRDTAYSGWWQPPFISANEDGDIVFEWWSGVRKLTVYIGATRSSYVKSWGLDIVSEMEDGELQGHWDPTLWDWLFFV